MSNLVRTRFAKLNDIDAIAPLFDLYRQFYGEAPRLEQSREFLRQRLLLGESHLILAEHESEVIGFTQLFPSFSSVTLQRLWILNDLYVSEVKRSLGVGRSLLKAASEFGRHSGAKQLFLEGAVSNARARGLYEDFGFIQNADYYYYHMPLRGANE